MHSALMAATAVDDATIQTIAKLFYNSGYRAEALQTVSDPITLEFWYYEYEPLSAAHQREIRPTDHPPPAQVLPQRRHPSCCLPARQSGFPLYAG